MVPWAHPSPQPNGISIGAAVFAGVNSVIDGQTDRQTNGDLGYLLQTRYSSLHKRGKGHNRIAGTALITLLSKKTLNKIALRAIYEVNSSASSQSFGEFYTSDHLVLSIHHSRHPSLLNLSLLAQNSPVSQVLSVIDCCLFPQDCLPGVGLGPSARRFLFVALCRQRQC